MDSMLQVDPRVLDESRRLGGNVGPDEKGEERGRWMDVPDSRKW